MSNPYYTLQVDRCELGDDPDTWRFLVDQCVADEPSVVERFFDSQEGAVQYGSTWVAAQHDPAIDAAAIEQFRGRFHSYGFDVSAYSDDQIRRALREEAVATTDSNVDLFVRAFQRLRRVEPNRRCELGDDPDSWRFLVTTATFSGCQPVKEHMRRVAPEAISSMAG